MEKRFSFRVIALIVAMVLIGILSFTVAGEYFSSPETYSNTIKILDEKRNNVTGISGMALAASAGVAAVPGDATTPVANELANLASTSMIIVVAIIFEKYLLVLSGLLTFKILVPVACILGIGYVISNRKVLAKLAAKLVLFGLCFVLVVPVSTQITNVIDQTHQMSVVQNMEEVEKMSQELAANADKEESVLKKFFNKVKNGVTGTKEKAETLLGTLIDAIAIMIVTSCVIPLATLWCMLWLARTILGIDVKVPTSKLKSIARRKTSVQIAKNEIEEIE